MEIRRWVVVGLLGFASLARGEVFKPTEEAVKDAGDKLDYEAWDQLLKTYVDDKGRVNYAKLKTNAADRKTLEKLYAQVAVVKPESLGDKKASLAFHINAYNIIVWKNVLDNSPKEVKESLYKFFRRDYVVMGKTTDLDALEKKTIRPTFREPRVHMALNCASGGCPILPTEAFTPDKVTSQLEREAKKFCNEERNVSYDAATKTVKLSHIFDWYDKDFAKDAAGRIEWINKRRAADKQIPTDSKIVFVDYDWHLNDPSLAR